MDLSQLRLALTPRGQASPRDNERLEFLGDAVLGFVVADVLDHHFPDYPPGTLTELRSRVVSATILAKVADDLELKRYIAGEPSPRTLGDAVEALIAALHISGGFRLASQFAERTFGPYLERAADMSLSRRTPPRCWKRCCRAAAQEAGLGGVKITVKNHRTLPAIRAEVTAGTTVLGARELMVKGRKRMRRNLELIAGRLAMQRAQKRLKRRSPVPEAGGDSAESMGDSAVEFMPAVELAESEPKLDLPQDIRRLSKDAFARRRQRVDALATEAEVQLLSLADKLGFGGAVCSVIEEKSSNGVMRWRFRLLRHETVLSIGGSPESPEHARYIGINDALAVVRDLDNATTRLETAAVTAGLGVPELQVSQRPNGSSFVEVHLGGQVIASGAAMFEPVARNTAVYNALYFLGVGAPRPGYLGQLSAGAGQQAAALPTEPEPEPVELAEAEPDAGATAPETGSRLVAAHPGDPGARADSVAVAAEKLRRAAADHGFANVQCSVAPGGSEG
ncbi:hypothetical protein DFJ74DRAFT_458921 [Hyaloraphidium curvatum]|nr:hypothetical protein DFJ74DRAFT_458921 [Hyaloraphidium curvatum]